VTVTAVDSRNPQALKGHRTPGEARLTERSGAGTSGYTVREDRTPGEESPKSRFFGFGWRKEYRMGRAFSERQGRTGGEQPMRSLLRHLLRL